MVTTLLQNGSKINIFGARKTFEVEIGMQSGQDISLMEKFANIVFAADAKTNPKKMGIELWKKVRSDKTKFSESILNWLSSDEKEGNFIVPKYISDAFDFLNTNDEESNNTTISSN